MRDEKKNGKNFFNIVMTLSVLALTGGLVSGAAKPGLPKLGELPPFQLTDSRGQTFDEGQLKGKVWVAAFFTSSCHVSCPKQAAYMASLQGTWGKAGLQLVSFTMDPAHDSPKALVRFSKEHHAGQDWHFLTGEKSDLYRLAERGFRINGEKENSGELPGFIHTTRMALVDGQGVIRGYYDSALPADQVRLEQDLSRLL